MDEKEFVAKQIVKNWFSLIVNNFLYFIAVVGWIISLFNHNIKWGWICVVTMILLTFVSNMIKKQLNALIKYFVDNYGIKDNDKETPTK